MADSLKLVGHFVLHIVIATFLFGVVTLAAVGLWEFTEWLKEIGAPYEIWIVSHGVAELVFWLDALCFVLYVITEAWKLVREIIDGVRRG